MAEEKSCRIILLATSKADSYKNKMAFNFEHSASHIDLQLNKPWQSIRTLLSDNRMSIL